MGSRSAVPADQRFFVFRQRRKEAVMRDWQKITTLPKHAPLNAAYGQPTGYRSFLGGSIWAWADAEGRYLGESNAVPANMCGEKTKPGKEEKPGKIVIDAEEIAKLEFGIGEAYVYDIDKDGKVVSKEIRNKNPLAGKQ